LPVIVERQVNTESQLQDLSPLARRRRILLQCRSSLIGPKRTSLAAPHMSAFEGKADMAFCGANVRF